MTPATIIQAERAGRQGRLTVGCAAAVFDATGERILLVRRADSGRWCVPGGYMDPGEGVAEACAREVWEETGLHVRVTRLIGVYTNPHILLAYPDGNRWQIVALFFAAERVGGDLRPSDETTDVGYFTLAEAKQIDIHDFSRLRIEDAFAGQVAAFVRDDIQLG